MLLDTLALRHQEFFLAQFFKLGLEIPLIPQRTVASMQSVLEFGLILVHRDGLKLQRQQT
jgi:hypothetical protein